MDPTYHMMNMLRAIEALPKGWLENDWLSRIRIISGLFGVLFIGIAIISLVFLLVDFQAMQLHMSLSIGNQPAGESAGLAKSMIIGLCMLSLLLAVVSFFVDFLCRTIQRRNLFIHDLKTNIKGFSRSYEPETLVMDA